MAAVTVTSVRQAKYGGNGDLIVAKHPDLRVDEDEKVALDGPDASLLPELNLVISYPLTL